MSSTSARAVILSFPPAIPQNPYQRLFYEALARHGFVLQAKGDLKLYRLIPRRKRVRVLHFHWPQPYYRHFGRAPRSLSWVKLGLFAFRLAVCRALGFRIAWTMHEVYPLEPATRGLDHAASWLLSRLAQVILVNDEATADEARSELGRGAEAITVVPHSSYIGAYPEGRSREDVRKQLGISPDAFVFLLFGHIGRYKHVEWFVDAFREARIPGAALVVAGAVGDEPAAEHVRRAAALDDRIKSMLEFVPDARVAELYGAADAAICPRQDGGTSGALVLALSLGVPALAADVSPYVDITNGDTTAFLYRPYDAASASAAMRAAASDPTAARMKGDAGRRAMSEASWDEMAAVAAKLFRECDRNGATATSSIPAESGAS